MPNYLDFPAIYVNYSSLRRRKLSLSRQNIFKHSLTFLLQFYEKQILIFVIKKKSSNQKYEEQDELHVHACDSLKKPLKRF